MVGTNDSGLGREERVRQIKWYHHFDFGDGLFTHDKYHYDALLGKADTIFRYGIADKSFLDIGAWDGFFSFEAEKRGASRVLATDHFCWSGAGWGTQDGFKLARELLSSRVEDQEIDIPQISPNTVGIFDVVYMGGVLYHVHDLIAPLQIVFSVTREYAIIETALDLEDLERPALSFVRGKAIPSANIPLSQDPTNFFGPNSAAVVAMLEHVGFSRVEKLVVQTPPGVAPRGYFYAWK